MVEVPSSDEAAGKAMAPYVKWMVMEVYRLLGWDEKRGKPLISTLKKSGLDEYIKDIW